MSTNQIHHIEIIFNLEQILSTKVAKIGTISESKNKSYSRIFKSLFMVLTKVIANNKRQYIRYLLSLLPLKEKRIEAIDYGKICWQILMKNLNPEYLKGCTFYDGDTFNYLLGIQDEYCINIIGNQDSIEYVNKNIGSDAIYEIKTIKISKVDNYCKNMEPIQYRCDIDDKGIVKSHLADELCKMIIEMDNWKL